jgi:hypothetical protein
MPLPDSGSPRKDRNRARTIGLLYRFRTCSFSRNWVLSTSGHIRQELLTLTTPPCIHGRLLGNKARSAAQAVVEDERVSVIFGHTHKASMSRKQRQGRGAAHNTVAYSPGCLCRTDGTVPSTKGGIDPFGKPIKSFEDWQQGMAIVRYQPDGKKFHIEDIPIISGWAMRSDGQQYGVAA